MDKDDADLEFHQVPSHSDATLTSRNAVASLGQTVCQGMGVTPAWNGLDASYAREHVHRDCSSPGIHLTWRSKCRPETLELRRNLDVLIILFICYGLYDLMGIGND